MLVVQLLGHAPLFASPWTAEHQASLSFTISRSLLKLIFTESMMLSNNLILFCLLLFCPQYVPGSGSFSMSWLFTLGGQSIGASVFSISPSKEYSVLIYFGIDWFDLLIVQGTVETFLHQHNLKPSILHFSVFFMVQRLHTYE